MFLPLYDGVDRVVVRLKEMDCASLGLALSGCLGKIESECLET